MQNINLPIHKVRDQFAQALQEGNRLVLTAPTGTGKSTQVPQFLLDLPEVSGQILVLQPRRLAARFLAARVAEERDSELGGEIGFQTRFETQVSARTRVCFITEGILPRLFLSDPRLESIGAIVFDEFHERPLAGDIGLGLVKQLQESARPDLKVIVMSATLGTEQLADYLGDCRVLEVETRNYPVEIGYQAPKRDTSVWDQAAKSLAQILESDSEGDVLIFMPGAFEIRKTIEACQRLRTSQKLLILPLHGSLPPEEQHRIMDRGDSRKIIVSTNIAETSLTIPGIRHVIDSGLVRLDRFDPSRGVGTLNLETISRHSAEQRSGRAGREAPGTCVRLWSLQEQSQRPAATDPEIQRTDLSEVVLHLSALGIHDIRQFPWLEPPAETAVSQAEILLRDLGALTAPENRLSAQGRQMANFPAHPRLSKLMLAAHEGDCLSEVTLIAAILSERSVLQNQKEGIRQLAAHFANSRGLPDSSPNQSAHSTEPVSDLFVMINALEAVRHQGFNFGYCDRLGINANAARQVWRTQAYFITICRKNRLRVNRHEAPPESVLLCLLAAFPDHLAHRRDAGTLVCNLRDGRHGELAKGSTVRQASLLLACDVRETGGRGRPSATTLSLASEVRREWLEDLYPDGWDFIDQHVWNDAQREVERHTAEFCLGVQVSRTVSREVVPDEAAAILAAEVVRKGLAMKGWDKEVNSWIQRVRWTADICPERGLITYDDDDRLLIMEEICAGERRYTNIKNKPCLPYVLNVMSWNDQEFVRKMAPERIRLPNNKSMRLSYRVGHPPQGRARIQELYDLEETPKVADGRIPVLLEILAPNMRAVQITDDLAGFWKNLYPSVSKELSRRYPRHEWR
jgi:ATP-dependent helicase HrpB